MASCGIGRPPAFFGKNSPQGVWILPFEGGGWVGVGWVFGGGVGGGLFVGFGGGGGCPLCFLLEGPLLMHNVNTFLLDTSLVFSFFKTPPFAFPAPKSRPLPFLPH